MQYCGGNMSNRICFILVSLLIFFLLINNSMNSFSQDYSVSSIIIDVFYDIDLGSGYVNQTIIISWREKPPVTINIPLLKPPGKGRYDVFNCSDLEGNPLPFTVNYNNNTVTIMINNTRVVKIDYMIYDYFDEISPGTYVGMFDLFDFRNISYVQLNLFLPSEYKVVDIEPSEGTSISLVDNTTKIVINKPQIYFIVVSIISIETPVSVPTPISGYGNNMLFYIFLAVVAGLVITGLSLYLYWRKKYSVEIESISPSILEDDTSKKIIEIVGDAGETGVKQSELVKLTGRPKSSISRRIKRLSAEGYIEVIRAGKHNIIKLTSKGLEVYKEMKKSNGEFYV